MESFFLILALILLIVLLVKVNHLSNAIQLQYQQLQKFIHPVKPEIEKVTPPVPHTQQTTPPPLPAPITPPPPPSAPEKPVSCQPKICCKTAVSARPESDFEKRAKEAWNKIWNWLIVGEDFRPKGIAMEYAVATVWLVRGAVLLLLIGIAFFLKYSHDNSLLPPELRLSAGGLVGVALLIVGSKIAFKQYRLIGIGLIGCGIGSLYFVGFAGVGLYQVIPPLIGFMLMVLVTVTAAVLALRHNALLIAVISTLGGYITPLLISTGEKNLPGLFSYLLLIAAGSLLLARYRNWKTLNIITFGLHYAIFILVLLQVYMTKDFVVTFTYASLYFLLFSLLPIFYNLVKREKITLIEILLMLTNSAIYLSAGLGLLYDYFDTKRYGAILTLGMTGFFLLQILVLLKRKQQDRNLLFTLFTLASFTLTLTFPLLLAGPVLVTAWAAESAIILYLGRKVESRFLSTLAMLLYAVTAVLTLNQTSTFHHSSAGTYWHEALDRLMGVGSFALSLLAGFCILRQSPPPEKNQFFPVSTEVFRYLAVFGLLLFAFWESFFFSSSYAAVMRNLVHGLLILGALWFVATQLRRYRAPIMLNVLFCILIVLLSIHFSVGFEHWSIFCRQEYFTGHALVRLAEYLLLASGLFFFAQRDPQELKKIFLWLAMILWFIYSTLELGLFLRHFQPGLQGAGISLLWAIYSLLLIFFGIKKEIKSLRLTGLILFVITALKAIFYDMHGINTLYRIGAFLLMGLLMLLGAYFYIKMKKIFETGDKKS